MASVWFTALLEQREVLLALKAREHASEAIRRRTTRILDAFAPLTLVDLT